VASQDIQMTEAEFWEEDEPEIYGQRSADEVVPVPRGISRDSLEVVPIIWDNRHSMPAHCHGVGALGDWVPSEERSGTSRGSMTVACLLCSEYVGQKVKTSASSPAFRSDCVERLGSIDQEHLSNGRFYLPTQKWPLAGRSRG